MVNAHPPSTSKCTHLPMSLYVKALTGQLMYTAPIYCRERKLQSLRCPFGRTVLVSYVHAYTGSLMAGFTYCGASGRRAKT